MSSGQQGSTASSFVLRPSALRVETSETPAATSTASVVSQEAKAFNFTPLSSRPQLVPAAINVSNGTGTPAPNGTAKNGFDEVTKPEEPSQSSAEPEPGNFVFGQNLEGNFNETANHFIYLLISRTERAIMPIIPESGDNSTGATAEGTRTSDSSE